MATDIETSSTFMFAAVHVMLQPLIEAPCDLSRRLDVALLMGPVVLIKWESPCHTILEHFVTITTWSNARISSSSPITSSEMSLEVWTSFAVQTWLPPLSTLGKSYSWRYLVATPSIVSAQHFKAVLTVLCNISLYIHCLCAFACMLLCRYQLLLANNANDNNGFVRLALLLSTQMCRHPYTPEFWLPRQM